MGGGLGPFDRPRSAAVRSAVGPPRIRRFAAPVPAARHHFSWIAHQTAKSPAWWNRGVRDVSRPDLRGADRRLGDRLDSDGSVRLASAELVESGLRMPVTSCSGPRASRRSTRRVGGGPRIRRIGRCGPGRSCNRLRSAVFPDRVRPEASGMKRGRLHVGPEPLPTCASGPVEVTAPSGLVRPPRCRRRTSSPPAR